MALLTNMRRGTTGEQAALEQCDGFLVDELFTAQARARPHAIAVREEGAQLTFAALDALSARVAEDLGHLGAQRGDLVALCLPRSARVVVAILGIFKAGCAYVPLDPSNPTDRLRHVLRDSGCRLLVTTAALLESHRLKGDGIVTLCLDESVSATGTYVERATNEAIHAPRHADDLAYIMYTSGSTGVPKGVRISHRNIVSLFVAAQAEAGVFDFSADDVWTLCHSYGFDFSVWEMWGALLHGGTLVVVAEEALTPRRLLRLVEAEEVSILNLVPSMLRYIAAELERDDSYHLSVRKLFLGGEAIDASSALSWLRYAGHEHLVNLYGLTENTVAATFKLLTASDLSGELPGRSPIGRAFTNLNVQVLDDDLRPVPPNALGEIFISGRGLSSGYHNRPSLTRERFMTLGGEVFYRTGDLATRDAAGEIYFAGRRDHQVSLRGYRIELGEIEAAMSQLPEVDTAVAVLGYDVSATPVITVFFTTPRDVVRTNMILDELRMRLPRYMVPGRLVQVSEIPVATSGKIDRQRLVGLADMREAAE